MRGKNGRHVPYERRKFYVFYDDKDNVRHCGTAQQLVDEGLYSSISSFYATVNHINKTKVGKVLILK